MSVTRSIEQVVKDEIAKAMEENADRITSENADTIFKYKFLKTGIDWVVRCCTVCKKPNFVHQEPWDDICQTQPANQTIIGEYIEQLENHRRFKQLARNMMPENEEEEEEEYERMRPRNPRLRRSKGEKLKQDDHLKQEEYRVDKKTKFKHREFSEEEYRVDKKTKFKHQIFSEEVFWNIQLNDFLNQNPTEDDEWWRNLNLEVLKKLLNHVQILGKFKPRNPTEEYEKDDEEEVTYKNDEEEYEINHKVKHETDDENYEEKMAYLREDDDYKKKDENGCKDEGEEDDGEYEEKVT